MGEGWAEIAALLKQHKLLAMTSMKTQIMALENPMEVIAAAGPLNYSSSVLNDSMLTAMIEHVNSTVGHSNGSNKATRIEGTLPTPQSRPEQVVAQTPTDLARTVAPIEEPKPLDIKFRNNLPDWNQSDFSTHASDVSSDITVHFDITGNSVTEGKMTDITACFNDRLKSIRKLIVQNSNLPRKHQEIARLLAETNRYQGHENKAAAIGLVNEPRYTKNGHLIWGLEDETGEMTCLLTKRKGEDRDRAHEAILEAGLMPDDVLGVSGTFSQTGDLFYVDDLHFPLESRHQKVSAEQGVSVAFLSDIHVGSKTFLEAQWHKMVRWFHSDPLAKTIKYLIL